MNTKLMLSAIAVAIAGSALASDSLYTGTRGLKDQKITVRSWGSGTISETDELVFEGAHSLRISTRNYFQGGKISMGSGVSVADAFGDKNNMLVLTFRTASSGTTLGGGKGPGAPGGPGSFGPGGPGGFGPPGGGKGPAGGKGGLGAGSTTPVPALKNIRLIVSTTDGRKSEVYSEIPSGSDANWTKIGVPLQAIMGFADSNKTISEIALSGDSVGSFYVGRVEVQNDSTPIQGEMNYRSDLNIGLNTEVSFSANGYSGASPLKYSWSFNNDGQVDAEGQFVKRRFRKEGTYKVTLTISDVYGLKKPYSTSINVKVNP